MSSVISITSRVADYLEKQPVGFQFKTRDLLKIINEDTQFSGKAGIGAVSGVMFRATALGLVTRELEPSEGRKHRPGYIYTLASRFEMDTRLWKGPGGARGRTWSAKVKSRMRTCLKSAIHLEEELLPTEGKLTKTLAELAELLAGFSDEELWQELERRTQPSEVKAHDTNTGVAMV